MLVRDEANQRRQAAILKVEADQAQLAQWIEDQTLFAKYVDDPDLNPLASERKIGKPMTHAEMENRLAKLNSKIRFVWGPLNKEFKKMYLDVPSEHGTAKDAGLLPGTRKVFDDSGLKDLGIVYPTGVLPERSIWRSSVEYFPDPNYRPKGTDKIDPRDWEMVPRTMAETIELFHAAGIDCEVREDSNEVPPKNSPYAQFYYRWVRRAEGQGEGWIRRVLPLGEKTRGWRTVVVRLVESRVLTTSQVEKEFLNDNTQEWRSHMGFGVQVLPW